MDHRLSAYAIAVLGTGAVAWLSVAALPWLGLASAALLFLLPVLFASVRGGIGPGLFAALSGAAAYNFLLLPPVYSFRIHGLDNLVSVGVLVAVALVTSRLATLLKAREIEALARAKASEEAAAFSALLAEGDADSAPARGIAWLDGHYGAARMIDAEALPAGDAAFTPLDRSAASWAQHNGDVTGHGTELMPVADWSFFPLAESLLAIARPDGGATRSADELAQLRDLVRRLGQAGDRAALETERRERERAEQSDRLRRSLLASLAHDFRTPLTVISGRLDALAATSPEASDALEQARRLDRRIEDLFGAARLEEGTLAPMLEPVDLVDAVSAASESLPTPAGIKLARSIPANLPFVSADPVLLHHILINLLDNALRHAATRVEIEATKASDGVALSITDDGPGIPEADRARIFERFARVEGGDRKGSSGLGLSIVKGFAEAIGIIVSVCDAPGGGACFTLTLPLAEDGAP